MLDPEKQKVLNQIQQQLRWIVNATVLLLASSALLIYVYVVFPELREGGNVESVALIQEELPEFENGIHLATGFKEDAHLNLVIANCTSCHSAKMVTQNRATRDGWKSMIRWMQETQNLWDLGENEDAILDYLAKYYSPEKQGRRLPLTGIDWYELDN